MKTPIRDTSTGPALNATVKKRGLLASEASSTPDKRLRTHGVTALSDTELIAVVLGSGKSDKKSFDLATTLNGHFGGLRQMMHAGSHNWSRVTGSDGTTSAALLAAFELGRRCLLQSIDRDGPLESPQSVVTYLHALLSDREREVFGCLFLDSRHRVIEFEEMFLGTIDGAVVHPREVVRQSLHYNAAAVIVAHNHPSGIPEPSQADVSLTHRLRDALSLVDIRLLDHLVVGQTETVSLSRRGVI